MGNCITLKNSLKTCCADVDVHHPVKIQSMSVREIEALPSPPSQQRLLEKGEIIEEPDNKNEVLFSIGDTDEFGLEYDSDFSVDSNELSEIELGNM